MTDSAHPDALTLLETPHGSFVALRSGASEAEQLYHEIYSERTYAGPVEWAPLPDGAIVLDAGANLGLYSSKSRTHGSLMLVSGHSGSEGGQSLAALVFAQILTDARSIAPTQGGAPPKPGM